MSPDPVRMAKSSCFGGKAPDGFVGAVRSHGLLIVLVTALVSRLSAAPIAPAEIQSNTSHWSLKPLTKPRVPPGGGNPLDAFMRARREAGGLHSSPAADRRTLIRRLTYDLNGLPPTPEEVASFEADANPAATEALVSRLLASPRYGERWARRWLDVVHYADTHGNDHDHARPNAWPYRDYVIRSFNEDKPYARFVQEQVAGDALFPKDPQATVALGFLAAGPWDETLMVGVREDTVDHRMAQVLDRDDMVTTVMSTFQSLTVHCARCHNHKFDPVSQREYYALQAVFAGVDRAERPFDSDPAVHVQRQDLMERRSAIARRDPAVLSSLDTPSTAARVAKFSLDQETRRRAWQELEVVSIASASGAETAFTRQTDGSWFVSGARPERDTFLITARTTATDIRALRLEALPDERLPGRGPGRYEPTGNFHLTEFRVDAQPTGGTTTGAARAKIVRATADHSDRGDLIAHAIDDRANTFWSVHPRYGEAHEAVFEFQEPLGDEAGTTLLIRMEQNGTAAHQLGRFRLSLCTGALPGGLRPPMPAAIAKLLGKPEAARTADEQRDLALEILAAEVENGLAALPKAEWVYAVTHNFPANGSHKPAPQPRPIHRLIRGELSQPAELVDPGALGCIPGLQAELSLDDTSDESLRRAALARWLTDANNALLWRSIVNRVWQAHFGRGLCESPNDFGKMGGEPSHPELLDWLALWFRDEAQGSLKSLHRLIVTSDTYQQGSQSAVISHQLSGVARGPSLADEGAVAPLDPEHLRTNSEVDPDNRLLWRMNRTRLTAEELRDSLLQLSGQIDLTMGGPAVVQFMARGKDTFMPDGGAPAFLDYEHFLPDAPENRRRAIYRFLFRTVPDPLMDALDSPDGGALTPVRSESTTAIQAFALLNNPFVIRQCEHIAARIQAESPEGMAVESLFGLLLQRPPTTNERARVADYARDHGLANAVQVIVNSNEFLHLD